MSESTQRLGLSGYLAKAFVRNPLTPVLAIAGLLLGLIAVLITPREEEPQIDVTMANVMVAFAGATAAEVESMVSSPLEQMLAEIEGVKHVYSLSNPGQAVLTVEFDVGIPRQQALVRLYNQVYSNLDWAPQNLGVSQPLVRPKGIDDVPIFSLSLHSETADAIALGEVARTLEAELKKVPGTRDVFTIGAPDRAVMVELDASKLATFNLTADELTRALQGTNSVRDLGQRQYDNQVAPVTAGRWLANETEVADLVIGARQGKPILLSDVASIRRGSDVPTQYVWHATRDASNTQLQMQEAVTIAVAKKPGSNASDITREIQSRLVSWKQTLIPDGIEVEITRDYGYSANDKAMALIQKLIFATLTVILLVLIALGWREAVVVGAAVVLTLALTLFASWAMGFTINRVSLFALIFSIGILVDDAIVIVENIHRHMTKDKQSLVESIPHAVDEVGAPTILATFTVIAALLPMAFVSGLMGPYMRPIPINASAGMLLSLLIALTVTPWLANRLLKRHSHSIASKSVDANAHDGETTRASKLSRLFNRVMRPFLDPERGSKRRRWLALGVFGGLFFAVLLGFFQLVVLKMLPLDNKSEFQIVADLPEGTTLETTNALLTELSQALLDVPEVTSFQAYAGTSAPVNFNGLVRQYDLRRGANVGDLQVNLKPKHERDRQSHEIALAVRPLLTPIANRYRASIKVTEVPPGPPVLAPLVAEVYGPDFDTTYRIAAELQKRFANTKGIVDIDSSVVHPAPRETLIIDRERAARLGISPNQITETLGLTLQGVDVTYLRSSDARKPVPIRLRLPEENQSEWSELLKLKVRSSNGNLIPISELLRVETQTWDQPRYHKNLAPVVYVTADEAGQQDSPLYGMFKVVSQLNENKIAGQKLEQYFFSWPTDVDEFAVKWDGEWQITFETFRDMGLAYSAGLVLIYLLVVAQFRSYIVPLIIMAPIPLTVIGVMPGHALLGAQFTATSMIGMIALAGIIVRNSILLVDFINHALAQGMELADAVVEACSVRAKPIALTALAAMGGAFFILDDPIFNGLAISLIFGILVSTILTLVVIPLLYFVWLQRKQV